MKKIVVLCAFVVISCGLSLGQSFKVLYSFGANSAEGLSPVNNLVADSAGNLYGTAYTGGAVGTCFGGGCGVVFELSPDGHGGWTETAIHTFCQGGTKFDCPEEGGIPRGLAIDSKGNLFGTTQYGGNQVQNDVCSSGVFGVVGCGVAYELSPPSVKNGTWKYTLLYSFCSEGGTNCTDGASPVGLPTLDAAGNLYGTTFYGGISLYGSGVVFKLSQKAGVWTETVYDFCSQMDGVYCADGANPTGGVAFDRKGNLYVTTFDGGSATQSTGGALIRLTPGNTGWTNTVVKTFSLVNYQGTPWLAQPRPVTIDSVGNIYTATVYGGNQSAEYPLGSGQVFEFTLGGSRKFLFNGVDGSNPYYPVTVDDARGMLFGVSGEPEVPGNIFQINKQGQEKLIYSFCQQSGCSDGNQTTSGLLEDASGNLYGVTGGGGAYKAGVVYELTP